MKPRIANRLAEVLKSGNFKKGEHKLCTISDSQYRYCCLGVLTELYNYERKLQKKKQLEHRILENSDVGWQDPGGFEFDRCPDIVKNWSGLQGEEENTLIDLNDNNDTWTKVINKLKQWGKE